MENIVEFVRDCIIEYEYPLSSSMNFDELSEIFKPQNRCFLISWIFKVIGEEKQDVSEYENNITVLGQHLYHHGFCTKEEITPFMTGVLGVSEQFKILRRIFTFIKLIKKPGTDSNLKSASFDEIENLSQFNLNLFPTFGEIKTFTEEPKISKTEDVDHKKNCKDTVITSIYSDISKVVENMDSDLSNLKNICESGQKQDDNSDFSKLRDPEALQEFNQCKENINLILQLIKDFNIIEEVITNNEDILKNNYESSRYGELLKSICEEICSIIRL